MKRTRGKIFSFHCILGILTVSIETSYTKPTKNRHTHYHMDPVDETNRYYYREKVKSRSYKESNMYTETI